MRANQVVVLTITTFRGVSPGAEHYYGSMRDANFKLEKVDIEKILTEKDDWEYRAGSTFSRFDSESEIIEIAKRIYKDVFLGFDILLCGSDTTAEPIQPIDGPVEFMESALKIYAEYDAIPWVEKRGFYDRTPEDRKRVNKLTEQWQELFNGR